jgi:hypothetical protein
MAADQVKEAFKLARLYGRKALRQVLSGRDPKTYARVAARFARFYFLLGGSFPTGIEAEKKARVLATLKAEEDGLFPFDLLLGEGKARIRRMRSPSKPKLPDPLAKEDNRRLTPLLSFESWVVSRSKAAADGEKN